MHSMGALIGEEMQQQYPELRRPTILMAPIPVDGALPITLRILTRHPLTYLKTVLTLSIHSLAKTPEQVRELFFDCRTPEGMVVNTTAQLKHAPFWIYCQFVLRRMVCHEFKTTIWQSCCFIAGRMKSSMWRSTKKQETATLS